VGISDLYMGVANMNIDHLFSGVGQRIVQQYSSENNNNLFYTCMLHVQWCVLMWFVRQWCVLMWFVRQWCVLKWFDRQWCVVKWFVRLWCVLKWFVRQWCVVKWFVRQWCVLKWFVRLWCVLKWFVMCHNTVPWFWGNLQNISFYHWVVTRSDFILKKCRQNICQWLSNKILVS
jgi:hypothetical protein